MDKQILGDEPTQRVTDDVRFFDVQVIHQAHDVGGHFSAIHFRIQRLLAFAMTTMIEGDHLMILAQLRQDAESVPISLNTAGQPVDQDNRLSLPFDHVVNFDAVGIEGIALRRGRFRFWRRAR